MRLAISNIAWDVSEDEIIAKLLQRFAIDAIDIVPSKYFPQPDAVSEAEILRVKNWWFDFGIEITGMQSLLFGTAGLNIFGTVESQEAILERLSSICRIGATLGVKYLVFGSPKSRDREGVDDASALYIAISFFRRLGAIARSYNVIICLEPIPEKYGSNFMRNSIETLDIVKQIDHPFILMQLDTGAMTTNNEDPDVVVSKCAPFTGYIHASEPDLSTVGEGGADHAKVAAALRKNLAKGLVSIEMLATRNELHKFSIERALITTIKYYRNNTLR